jgi:hypothetical protein
MTGDERKGPPTLPDRDEQVRERRLRALEEPLEVRPRPGTVAARFEVRNPRHQTRYEVFLPEFPDPTVALCGCEDFGRRDTGTCKHIEAVRLWLREEPGLGTPAPARFSGERIWPAIDRALERLARDPRPGALAWRKPGRCLFELPPG